MDYTPLSPSDNPPPYQSSSTQGAGAPGLPNGFQPLEPGDNPPPFDPKSKFVVIPPAHWYSPLTNIGKDVSDEAQSGLQGMSDAYQNSKNSLLKGESPSTGDTLNYLGNAAKVAFSPVTGASKALVGDPTANAMGIPSDDRDITSEDTLPTMAKKTLANTAELGAGMVMPGKALEAAGNIGTLVPSVTDAAKLLMNEGVNLPYGKMLGGKAQNLESAASSIPLTGLSMGAQANDMLDGFNRAVANRALAFVGKDVPKDIPAGYNMVEYTGRTLGDKLEQAVAPTKLDLSRVSQNKLDAVSNILNDVNPDPDAAPVHLVQGTVLPGKDWKNIDSILREQINSLNLSQDTANYNYAKKLDNIRSSLRGELVDQNPDKAKDLSDAMNGYAIYSRYRDAAAMPLSEGVVTPNTLLRKIGKNSSDTEMATGEGLIQDLAAAGHSVFKNIANSGTANRLNTSGAVKYALGTGEGAGLLSGNPWPLVADTGGATLYSKPVVNAVNSLVRRNMNSGISLSNLTDKATPLVNKYSLVSPTGTLTNDDENEE